MWVRLIGAPWWVRWIVLAAVIAAFAGSIWTFAGPNIDIGIGWPWRIAIWVGFGLVVAVAILVVQRPVQRAYADALEGLDAPQRSQAVKAIRRGEVPADRAVLAAAIRVGDLTAGYRRTASSLQNALPWLLPPLYVLLAVVTFLGHAVHQALVWLVFAVVFAVSAVWHRYKSSDAPSTLRCCARRRRSTVCPWSTALAPSHRSRGHRTGSSR